jgi:hypothetical protein
MPALAVNQSPAIVVLHNGDDQGARSPRIFGSRRRGHGHGDARAHVSVVDWSQDSARVAAALEAVLLSGPWPCRVVWVGHGAADGTPNANANGTPLDVSAFVDTMRLLRPLSVHLCTCRAARWVERHAETLAPLRDELGAAVYATRTGLPGAALHEVAKALHRGDVHAPGAFGRGTVLERAL